MQYIFIFINNILYYLKHHFKIFQIIKHIVNNKFDIYKLFKTTITIIIIIIILIVFISYFK